MRYTPNVPNPNGYEVDWCDVREDRCPDCYGNNLECVEDDGYCEHCGRSDDYATSYYRCLDCGRDNIDYPSQVVGMVYRVVPPIEIKAREWASLWEQQLLFGAKKV